VTPIDIRPNSLRGGGQECGKFKPGQVLHVAKRSKTAFNSARSEGVGGNDVKIIRCGDRVLGTKKTSYYLTRSIMCVKGIGGNLELSVIIGWRSEDFQERRGALRQSINTKRRRKRRGGPFLDLKRIWGRITPSSYQV